jgi:hypothetical protein
MKTPSATCFATWENKRRAIVVAVGAALACACAGAADHEPSAIQSYYYLVYWMSVNRPDLALEQFADDAQVVAGPACTPSAPCIGKAAILAGYLGALNKGHVPLPLFDQRFDGHRLRTRGEQVVEGDHVMRCGHVLEFRGGRIASLRLELDASSPIAFQAGSIRADGSGHVDRFMEKR